MNAQSESLRLSDIFIPPDRLRALDEGKAQLLAASIAEHGVFQPLAVYRSSAAESPYTLIFGLHRHRAAQIAGLDEVPVIVRTKTEADALEIAENLFRNDLTTMERADFVAAWFEANGVKRGRKSKAPTLAQLFPDRDLSSRAAEELGFSGRKAQRLCQIGRKLHPELKAMLRETPHAQNQVLLLKLASMPEAKQAGIVAGMGMGADLLEVLALEKTAESKPDKRTQALKRFVDAWNTMDGETKREALDLINQPGAASKLK